MTMAAVAASPAVSQQAISQPKYGLVADQTLQTISPQGGSNSGETFRATMESIHDHLQSFPSQVEAATRQSRDPVEVAKLEILPSPWELSPQAGAGAPITGDHRPGRMTDGNKILAQSFDHAIFVTLMSQVVSGLSQSATTLIRQQ